MDLINPSPIPKYFQLAEILRKQIADGSINPGEQLPTEDTLSQTYNLSRGTVREAIRVLEKDGLIQREQGRGTFVSFPQRVESTFFTLSSFNEDMRHQGRQPSALVLTAEVVPAPPEVAECLQIEVDEPTLHIVRLQLADGQPVVHETRYLAESLCPSLLSDDLESTSIHWLLIQKYNIPLVRMTHTVEAGSLSAEESNLLQAKPGATAFFVDRLTYTEINGGKVPAVWFRAIYVEENYHIEAHSRK